MCLTTCDKINDDLVCHNKYKGIFFLIFFIRSDWTDSIYNRKEIVDSQAITTCMRGSSSTAKLPMEFSSKYNVSFCKKLRSPPYCYAVLLDPRLTGEP